MRVLKSLYDRYTDRNVDRSPKKDIPDNIVIDEPRQAEAEYPDPLLERIIQCVEYVKEQYRKSQPVMQVTRFTIEKSDETDPDFNIAALDLLHSAMKEKYAVLVQKSDRTETYEIGVPRPDDGEAGIPAHDSVHDPQWWMGKSRAEIKAGAFATSDEIKKAEATLKGQDTKKNKGRKSQREKDMEWKMVEVLRRQELGLPMCDEDDEDENESESELNESNPRGSGEDNVDQ